MWRILTIKQSNYLLGFAQGRRRGGAISQAAHNSRSYLVSSTSGCSITLAGLEVFASAMVVGGCASTSPEHGERLFAQIRASPLADP